jgi:hypothetical protein
MPNPLPMETGSIGEEIAGRIEAFQEDARSPFEGTADVYVGGAYGTIRLSGFFFDPLPGIRVEAPILARRQGTRQPLFTSNAITTVGYDDIN